MTSCFVYGTLLSGEPNHRVLRGSLCLGPACTPPRFRLVDLGAYPGMLAGGDTSVVGELYEVNDDVLAALDRLEGHPRYYLRAPIILAGWRRAETYFFPAAQAAGRAVIESGDWRTWNKAKRENRCAW
jgi:gamma-glutamylaminecyclotransferase